MVKSFFQREKNILLAIGGLVLFALLVTLLAPAEETLGKSVRLVYLHGSLTWVGITMFTLAGLLGLIYILTSQISSYQWSSAFQYVSLSVWGINFLLSLVTMTLVWGRIAWGEPRMLMTTSILFLSLLIYLGSIIFEKPKLNGFLNFLMAVLLWVLLVKTKVVVHPKNAIASSPSLAIKIFSSLITLLLFITAGLTTILVKKRLSKKFF